MYSTFEYIGILFLSRHIGQMGGNMKMNDLTSIQIENQLRKKNKECHGAMISDQMITIFLIYQQKCEKNRKTEKK